MRPISLSYTPADDSTTGYKTGATGAGPFTMTTSTAGDGLAHITSLTSTANLSGITVTITGTDANGNAQTEAMAGPNNNTVYGTKYFKTITSVSVSSTLGVNTMDIGWKDTSITPSIVVDYRQATFKIALGIIITGTINYTVQHTFDNIFDPSVTPYWFNHDVLVGDTATADGNYAYPIRAVRLLTNSLTSGATLTLDIIQGNPQGG